MIKCLALLLALAASAGPAVAQPYPSKPIRLVVGYSAGGDGVYQLAPRMADSWAAAAMMAGHPNGVSPLSLR